MKLVYDVTHDVARIDLVDVIATKLTRLATFGLVFGYDREEHLVCIEVSHAKRRLPAEVLDLAETTAKLEHACPCCTCGRTKLDWSDREHWVRLDAPEEVAEAVMACALDGIGDRPRDGVPWGLPEDLAAALVPVVAEHLSAVDPDWRQHSVCFGPGDDPRRAAFKAALVDAIEKARPK